MKWNASNCQQECCFPQLKTWRYFFISPLILFSFKINAPHCWLCVKCFFFFGGGGGRGSYFLTFIGIGHFFVVEVDMPMNWSMIVDHILSTVYTYPVKMKKTSKKCNVQRIQYNIVSSCCVNKLNYTLWKFMMARSDVIHIITTGGETSDLRHCFTIFPQMWDKGILQVV